MATVVRSAAPVPGRQAAVGAALSSTELCVVRRAVRGARATVWRFPLAPLNGDGASWPALAAALNELSRTLGVAGGRLDVALMPPLTEIRRLDLPPMGEHELRMLLARNAPKFFVGARAPQLVGTAAAPQAGRAAAGGVIAAAAPMRLVAALHAAARESGWTVEAVSPAEGAWSAAASVIWPDTGRGRAHLLVCGTDRTELLELDHGRLAAVRLFREGALDAPLVADAIVRGKHASPTRLVLVGVSAQRQDLARALAASGHSLSALPDGWDERASSLDVLAAEFAGMKAAPLLRSEATLAQRRAASRRTIMRLAAASVVLLLLSAAFVFLGAKRQLRVVQAERAKIRPQLAATLVGRTSVETAFRQLAALAAAQRSATQWSVILDGISAHLDDDAYLTALRGRDDSLLVEGIAVRASRAFDSLVGTPGLVNVHAAAPVRRESPQGAPALERFTIGAGIATGGAAPITSPPTAAATPPASAATRVAP